MQEGPVILRVVQCPAPDGLQGHRAGGRQRRGQRADRAEEGVEGRPSPPRRPPTGADGGDRRRRVQRACSRALQQTRACESVHVVTGIEAYANGHAVSVSPTAAFSKLTVNKYLYRKNAIILY